jgi:hypothetical protein
MVVSVYQTTWDTPQTMIHYKCDIHLPLVRQMVSVVIFVHAYNDTATILLTAFADSDWNS